MVKVVGIDESAIKRVTCKNCAALLEYTPSEVQTKSVSDYSGSSDIVAFLRCPKCDAEVYNVERR